MSALSVVTHILLIGGSFVVFAALHSLAAGSGLRDRLSGVLGGRVVNGTYRLAYNLAAVVLLAIPVVLIGVLPDTVLYRVEPPLSFVLIGIEVIGVVGMIGALLQTDLMRFSGLRQFLRFINGNDEAEEGGGLRTDGLYRWMRHPLYVFSMVTIWALPIMTINILIFNVAASLYFILGSVVEERRLVGVFGEEYRQYRRRVGWAMPRLKL